MIRWTVSVCLAIAANGGTVIAQQQDPTQAPPVSKPAQTPAKPDKPAAPSLDDLLAQALKHNADIRVAEAKVREAEAELNRTRLQVTQKVVISQQAQEFQKTIAERAESALQLFEKVGRATSEEDLLDARQKLAQAKAKLSELDAELGFLTGKPSHTKAATAIQPLAVDFLQWQNLQGLNRPSTNLNIDWSASPLSPSPRLTQPLVFSQIQVASGSTTDKLRKALDTQVDVKFESAALHDVLEFLEKSASGVSFRILDPNDRDKEVTLKLKAPVSVGAVLQALEDSFTEGATGLRFVVRDYGILVTWEDRIPPGALRVESLWKADRASPAQKGTETDQTKKQQPPSDKPK